MAVLIGGAWPYANGSLHLGHIAALLPGDILARYYRLKGEDVLYVSGSDCNGTPISIRANQKQTILPTCIRKTIFPAGILLFLTKRKPRNMNFRGSRH